MRSFFAVLLMCLCALAVVAPADAWGQVGHKVVGAVAEAFLSVNAHAQVAAQLAPNSITGLPAIANTPDYYDLDNRGAWSAPLHYVNLLPNATHFSVWPLCMENNGCVVSAVFNYTERLAADYTSGTNQICSTAMGPGGDLLREPCALAFLTHFTGDIHQPLHAGYASDQGGNLFDVSFFGAPAQLHGVWDYDIIDLYLYREVLEWDSFAAELIAELKENPDVVESYASVLNADDWASESFEIMRETSYNFQPGVVPLVPIRHNFTGPAEPLRWERVTAREYREEYECMGLVEEMYYTRNLPVVKERLAMAGVRLATTLNNVYQAPAAPKSPLVAHAAQKMAELRQHQAEVGSAHSSIYYNVVCPANVPGKGCPCSVYPCYA